MVKKNRSHIIGMTLGIIGIIAELFSTYSSLAGIIFNFLFWYFVGLGIGKIFKYNKYDLYFKYADYNIQLIITEEEKINLEKYLEYKKENKLTDHISDYISEDITTEGNNIDGISKLEEELNKVKKLFDEEIISTDEYNNLRSKIIEKYIG